MGEIRLNRKEVLRYMRHKGEVSPELERKINQVEREVFKMARLKSTYQIYGVEVVSGKVSFAGLEWESEKLALNLKDSSELVLLAMTLGNEIDILIRRYGSIDGTNMLIAQAVATEYLEKSLDRLEEEIKSIYGFDLRPRFSPGYGDLDIVHQKEIIRLLDTHKKIGLSVTDNFMMTPTKSVTALVGITKSPSEKTVNKCAHCQMEGCEMKRDEI